MQIIKRIAFASRSPFMRGNRTENIAKQALDKMQINRVDPVLVLQETAQFYGILVPTFDGWEFVHWTMQDSTSRRVTVMEKKNDGLSATAEVDLFVYLSSRFLNKLIEYFAQRRGGETDVLLGYCVSELRQRRLRMDFSTYEIVKMKFPNLRFQFRLKGRDSATLEMARPISPKESRVPIPL